MKKLILLLVVVFTLLTPLVGLAEVQPIKVILNGEIISFDVEPTVIDQRTLVPLRAIFEKLGLEVGWYQETRTVIGTKDGLKIELPIGNKIASKNGSQILLDVPATIVNNRTLVPVRFIAESIGAKVGWDNSTRTVIINYTPDLSLISPDLNLLKRALINLESSSKLKVDTYQKVNVEYLNGEKMLSETTIASFGLVSKIELLETSFTSGLIELKESNEANESDITSIQEKDTISIMLKEDSDSYIRQFNLNNSNDVIELKKFESLGVNPVNPLLTFIESAKLYGDLFNEEDMVVTKLDNGDTKYTLSLDKEKISTKYYNTFLYSLLHYSEINLQLEYIIDKKGYLTFVSNKNINSNKLNNPLIQVKTITLEGETNIFYEFEEKELNDKISSFHTSNNLNMSFDAQLEQAIRKTINKPDGELLKSDVERITKLSASKSNISSLTGIQYLKNLRQLYLYDNNISDIFPLSLLPFLQELSLSNNQVSDITPLKNLGYLNKLVINKNKLTNIDTLGNLISLERLELDDNQISNIEALKPLNNLKLLSMNRNKVNDLNPIADLKNLYNISFSENAIEDLKPIRNLTNLKSLWLSNNNIKEIDVLINLIKLRSLSLSENNIEDIDVLSKLVNLESLYLNRNKIIDISSISRLLNLQKLYLGFNQINDVTPLKDLKSLKNLSIYENLIEDYSPLDSLTNTIIKKENKIYN